MRTLFCFLILVPCAQAGTIAYSPYTQFRSDSAINPVRAGVIQLREGDDNIIAEWRIEGITPSAEPRTWVMSEQDPAYPMFEYAGIHPDGYYFRAALTAGEPSGNWTRWRSKAVANCEPGGLCLDPWYEMTDVQQIEFHLEWWVLGVSHRRAVTYVGEGIEVPEPVSWLLCLHGLAITLKPRRRR